MRVFWLACLLAVAVADPQNCTTPFAMECTLPMGTFMSVGGSNLLRVAQNSYVYFVFAVPTPTPDNMQVSVAVVSGDADLYIKHFDPSNLPTPPSFFSFDFASRSIGSEDIVVMNKANLTAAYYAVAVHGFRNSEFRITLSSSGSSVQLQNGVVVTDTVDSGAYKYYTFTSADAQCSFPLTIVLMRLLGDPDLVVANGTWRPTLSNYTWIERAFGTDVLNIPSDCSFRTITIGVHGYMRSLYTIVVSQNETVQLVDGVAQTDTVVNGSARNFEFLVGDDAVGGVTVSLSLVSGSAHIFGLSGTAEVFPSRASNYWSGYADYFTPYELSISSADAHFVAQNGGYYFTVVGASNATASFSLVVKSGQSISPLRDGIPSIDFINFHAYRYYSFAVNNASLDVVFDLTPFSGDADMFVSCTRNPTGDNSGWPSIRNATWSSQQWGEDTLAIKANDSRSCVRTDAQGNGGTFYVAVYGFSNSTYSLLGSLDDGVPTMLMIGQPQLGTAFHGQTVVYIVQMPDVAQDITVTVTPSFGDPDVYVSFDGSSAPGYTNFAYKSSAASGTDSVVISASGSGCRYPSLAQCYCTSCYVYIGIVTFSARSSYSVVASTAESTTTLQDNVPVRANVAQGRYNYYRFNNPSDGAALAVSVTVFSGDADLTVSTRPSPTLSNGSWVSIVSGGDTITIPSADVGFHYIGVYGFTNASYSVVAHVQSPNYTTHLVSGIPQSGFVAAGDVVYFSLSVDAMADTTFTASPVTGKVVMFINRCTLQESLCGDYRPTNSSHQWTSRQSFSSEAITISATDPAACSQCTYMIGIFGLRASNFSVVASVANASSLITLVEGVPSRSYASAGAYTYFLFQFSDVHMDVVISVTPFAGDPDVYVSACPATASAASSCIFTPTSRNFTWRHSSVGADTIVVPWGAPNACAPSAGVACSYYIGVHGFSATSFSVLAYLHSDQPVVLQDGRPQNGAVNASVTDQYKFDIPQGAAGAEVVLIPRSGDADLYIRLDGQKPRSDFWQYRSISAFGNDNINILTTDGAWVSNCTAGCTMTIAVHGFQPSEYTIVARLSQSTATLMPGVPMRDSLDRGTYDYYVMSVNQPNILTFVLTPLAGDPDMYIGWGPNYAQPNNTNYLWAGRLVGVDVVVVHPSDPKACPVTPTSACNYYIGVTSYTRNASFSLLAYVQDTDPVTLIDGQPQTGQVDQGLTQGYVFYAPPNFASVQITLTPVIGDADLYIVVSSNDTVLPTRSNAQYRSTSITGSEEITIRAADPAVRNNCVPNAKCNIFVGVNGFTNSTYTVMATSGNQSSDLQDGVALYDTVDANEYVYYVFRNTYPQASLSFALSPISGDPDMYIATFPGPTRTNRTWQSSGIGRDVVEVFPNDPNFCVAPCNYYIAVTGWLTNASFSIVAQVRENATTQLSDGQPVVSSLGQGNTDQFVLYLLPGTLTVIVTLTPIFGDADLYVNVGVRPATMSNPDYISIASTGNDMVTVKSNDPAYIRSTCNPANVTSSSVCAVSIGVRAFSTAAFYTVVASTTNAVVLSDGSSFSTNVAASSYREFIFEVRVPNTQIVISVTPLSGDPDLFVSTQPHANRTNYMWRALSMGNDTVQIFPQDPRACGVPCRYFIGVTGFGSAAVFTISASTSSSRPVTLLDGRPQSGTVQQLTSNLYYFDVPPGPGFKVSVSAVYGDPDIYIRLDNVIPNATNAHYKSISTLSSDAVTVNSSAPLFQTCLTATNGSFCRAFIAVYGFRTSQYSVVATLLDATATLQEGIPVSGTVGQSMYTYYVFTAINMSSPYVISLTTLQGDPDMFVSNVYSQPNATAKTWYVNGIGNESITLDPLDPNVANCALPCRYYVGVYGFGRAAAFQLMVTRTNSGLLPLLVDGQPQRGHLNGGVMAYYRFVVSSSPGDIQFLVTPLFGTVMIFINNVVDGNGRPVLPVASCTTFPCSVTNYRWSSLTSYDRTTVTIPANSQYSCVGCTYVVGLLSSSSMAADYSITAATGETSINLADGVPHTDVVQKGFMQYYRLIVTSAFADVEVTVMPFYGDPDLFISWHANNSRPDATKSDMRENTMSNDTVYVQASRLQECFDLNDGTQCQVFIGILGFSNSSYSVVARMDGGFNSPVWLVDGTPQTALVRPKAYTYFAVALNVVWGTTFSFNMNPVYGDPDMYVTTDGMQPGQSYWNFTSIGTGFDSVIISSDQKGYCSRCIVYVAVYGYAQSQFAITYTTNTSSSVEPLRDGASSLGHASAGTYRYYKLFADAQSRNLTVSVSALSGVPEVYAMVETSVGSQYVLPTRNNSQWSSVSQGSTVLRIFSTDANWRAPATYVFGVIAPTSTAYLITASLSHQSITVLREGQPQLTSVSSNSYSYFSFTTGGVAANITVRVSNPALRVFANNNFNPQDYSTLPSRFQYMWTSQTDGASQNTLEIPATANDPNNPVNTIAVFAPSSGGSFSILASTTQDAIVLIPGAPATHMFVDTNATQYFRVDVADITQDLVISLTPLTGDPDLLVSRRSQTPHCFFNEAPNPVVPNAICVDYTWKVNTPYRDVLTISHTNPCAPPAASSCSVADDWVAGTFYIGVFAYTASTYDITVAVSGANALVPGQYQTASTSSTSKSYFQMQVSETTVKPVLKVEVVPIPSSLSASPLTQQPFGVTLYARTCAFDSCSVADRTPGPMNFMWIATIPSTGGSLFIANTDPQYCDPQANTLCNYYVAVYPDIRCTGSCSMDFRIRVVVQDGSDLRSILYSDVTSRMVVMADTLQPNVPSTYELWVGPPVTPSSSIFFRLEACVGSLGRPMLYVCVSSVCDNPSNPVDPANNGQAVVVSTTNGVAEATVPASANSVVFVTVAAPSSRRLLRQSGSLAAGASDRVGAASTGTWSYRLMATARKVSPLLVDSRAVTVAPPAAVAGKKRVGFSLKWAPLQVTAADGSKKPALGVVYTVVVTPGSFAANVTNSSACGVLASGATPYSTNKPEFNVEGLAASTVHSVAVVATCTTDCWVASGGAPTDAYVYQLEYDVASGTTGAGAASKNNKASKAGITALVVVLVIAGVAVVAGLIVYWRRKRGQREYQYQMYDVAGADGTYSTTAGEYASLD